MQRDWLGKANAEELAESIRAYWRARGCRVKIVVCKEPAGSGFGPFWGVVSDLVNGWPPRLDAKGLQALLAVEADMRRGVRLAA